MNDFTKNLLKTSATLMIIAGGSALLVGAVNAVTAPVISANMEKKQQQMLYVVFNDNDGKYQYTDTKLSDNKDLVAKLQYVNTQWTVKDGDQDLGTIYRCYVKNGYGDMDFLVGINSDHSLGNMSIISDTFSYKDKLETNFITPYNNSHDKQTQVEQVKTGATFASKLTRDAILEAQKLDKGEIVAGFDAKLFGDDVTYTDITATNNLSSYTYIKEIYQAGDKGYVIRVQGKEATYDGSIDLWVAVNADGTLHSIRPVSISHTAPNGDPQTYIDAINNASSSQDKDIAISEIKGAGSTLSNTVIRNMVIEAIKFVNPDYVPYEKPVEEGLPTAARFFGDGDYKDVSSDFVTSDLKYVKEVYQHTDGYVVRASGTYPFMTEEEEEVTHTYDVYVGINNSGSVTKIALADSDADNVADTGAISEYVNAVNNGTDPDEAAIAGATKTTEYLRKLIAEAKSVIASHLQSASATVAFHVVDESMSQPVMNYVLPTEERR